MKSREYDGTVQTFIQVILGAICQLAKRLYKEQLPEGKHTKLDKNKFRGVPKTSRFAESIFGQLDQLMRTNKGNNKITELRTILQRESQNS